MPNNHLGTEHMGFLNAPCILKVSVFQSISCFHCYCDCLFCCLVTMCGESASSVFAVSWFVSFAVFSTGFTLDSYVMLKFAEEESFVKYALRLKDFKFLDVLILHLFYYSFLCVTEQTVIFPEIQFHGVVSQWFYSLYKTNI